MNISTVYTTKFKDVETDIVNTLQRNYSFQVAYFTM